MKVSREERGGERIDVRVSQFVGNSENRGRTGPKPRSWTFYYEREAGALFFPRPIFRFSFSNES